jgi:hypothetical protein
MEHMGIYLDFSIYSFLAQYIYDLCVNMYNSVDLVYLVDYYLEEI